jgi:acylphosphatase
MRKRAQVFYSGRVQGVGFRYSARTVACGYEVTGAVRNLADGRVELTAEGEETEVRDFLEGIRESHLASHIRTEEVHWLPANGQFKGFGITN